MLVSVPRRRQAVRWVTGRYGERSGDALRGFQHAATELAFLLDRLDRCHAVHDFPRRERDLLAEVARTRVAAGGPRHGSAGRGPGAGPGPGAEPGPGSMPAAPG